MPRCSLQDVFFFCARINDASANVVFMTADGAKQALFAKGPEVYPRPNTEQLPEEHLWRVGVEHPKASDGLFLRLATVCTPFRLPVDNEHR